MSAGLLLPPVSSRDASPRADTSGDGAAPADVVQGGEGAIPMRHGAPWTGAEVAYLRSSYATRRSVASMMATLQRSEQSIRQMASKLGISRGCAPRADYRGAYLAAATGRTWRDVQTMFGLTRGDVRWWVVRYGGGLVWPPVSEMVVK